MFDESMTIEMLQEAGFSRCFPANIYLFKVNDSNTRKKCTIATLEKSVKSVLSLE